METRALLQIHRMVSADAAFVYFDLCVEEIGRSEIPACRVIAMEKGVSTPSNLPLSKTILPTALGMI